MNYLTKETTMQATFTVTGGNMSELKLAALAQLDRLVDSGPYWYWLDITAQPRFPDASTVCEWEADVDAFVTTRGPGANLTERAAT